MQMKENKQNVNKYCVMQRLLVYTSQRFLDFSIYSLT